MVNIIPDKSCSQSSLIFDFSANRREDLQEYQDFTDVERLAIIKHCATRWLSLERCTKRTINQWPALRSYFNSHNDVEKPGRVRRVAEWLAGDDMRLTFEFLSYILPELNAFNTFQVCFTTETFILM